MSLCSFPPLSTRRCPSGDSLRRGRSILSDCGGDITLRLKKWRSTWRYPARFQSLPDSRPPRPRRPSQEELPGQVALTAALRSPLGPWRVAFHSLGVMCAVAGDGGERRARGWRRGAFVPRRRSRRRAARRRAARRRQESQLLLLRPQPCHRQPPHSRSEWRQPPRPFALARPPSNDANLKRHQPPTPTPQPRPFPPPFSLSRLLRRRPRPWQLPSCRDPETTARPPASFSARRRTPTRWRRARTGSSSRW